MSYESILTRCLAGFVREPNLTRLAAAIRVDGRPYWMSANSAEGLLAGDARFPVYSITKTLIAICVLRLCQSGSLKLTDEVTKWFVGRGVPGGITLGHLLRHTSGLGDYGPLAEYHQAVRSRPGEPWSRQQFLETVLSTGMLFAPGSGWAYSNIGYMLLVEVLERATAQGFGQILSEVITKPLELQRTSVLQEIEDLSSCVPGYGPEVDAESRVVDVRGVYHPGWCAPGLVASTTEDITLVFDALLAGELLGPETLAEMLTLTPLPGDNIPPVTPAFGMGIFSDLASPHGRNYGHGGGGPGYDLDIVVLPDGPIGRVTVAAFVNSSCGPAARDCVAALLAEFLGDARVQQAAAPSAVPVTGSGGR